MKHWIKSYNLISILIKDIVDILNKSMKIEQKITHNTKLSSYVQFKNIHESFIKIKQDLKKVEKLL